MQSFLQRFRPLFAPDDALGADAAVVEDNVSDIGSDAGGEGGLNTGTPEIVPAMSIHESITKAFATEKAKADEAEAAAKPAKTDASAGAHGVDKTAKTPGKDSKGKFTKAGAQAAAAKPDTQSSTQAAKPDAATSAAAPPASWSKLTEVWDTIPDAAKAEIHKREAQMGEGVKALQTRYQPFETAIAPYREAIKLFRDSQGRPVNEGQAITQLFGWQAALAQPDKARAGQAFLALAQSHGIDLSTLAAASQGQQGAIEQPQSEIPASLIPILKTFADKIGGFETQQATQLRSAAENTVNNWAKDKPHFEKVRGLMKQLTESGVVPLLQSGHVDLDGAYNAAVKIHPEVAPLLAQEEQDKAAKAASDKAAADEKAKADKIAAAKRAGVSIRAGAPLAPSSNGALPPAGKSESARDSIKRALAELRQ